ncbi:type VI secretion system protein ImpL [Acinetobacter calcoaceticus]|uniref:Type VI secretion system protein ImpL n=1 Tax=Acinetobacter calcoaceticus TaxID=471 RepID=A0A4R1XQM3_ACICA|nr:type VI secretion system protein ImpL [Acinetobacter calcoaceticus]
MYTILGYLWQYVSNPKAIIALSLLVALLSSFNYLPRAVFWPLLAAYIVGLFGYAIYWLIMRRKHAKQGQELADAIEQDTASTFAESKDSGKDADKNKNKAELQLINQQIKQSVQLIRKSKLGDKKGNAALYELPWYMVIGNPAAGKSSAIYNSGLKFPFEESHQQMVSAGLSGTRNCDWFFSTEGVLLDTAGRYSVYSDDHAEWLGFLDLLKKNRSKAPINGLMILVSTAELISQSPEKSTKLAKNLRSRIQDITERLEIFAPVYLVFTKMDLIAGFTEFFECYEGGEFDQVWGATLPYEAQSTTNASALFEQHYNLLYDGLKSVSTTHLSRRHAQNISPSVMTFPLEFKTLKPILKSFISNLFEDNPYQFKPVFRGFYFTSALQEGVIESPMTEQIAQTFHLSKSSTADQAGTTAISQNHGYFLKGLFSDVILKDKNLVKQHINPLFKRKRYLGFILALVLVATCLGLWVWSYRNNQQLIADVQADLNKVMQMESAATQDLGSHLNALLIIQQRLQQLDEYDQDRPLQFSFGLYQGDQLRARLKTEYLNGIRQLILIPAQQNMAEYLQRVNQNAEVLKANHSNVQIQQASANKGQQYLQASDTDPQDAYNALKAYLMLSNKQYMEASHLGDQVTRFWRPWLEANRGQANGGELIQKAEQVLSYTMTLATDEKFPVLDANVQLVDQSRQVLMSVVRGMPARDRVYNEIKMRAAVRFPALTVGQLIGESNRGSILGGYAISGVFSQKAWEEYVETAIEEAANKPTDSKDWVLNTTQSDDLSFSGSPDQIRRQLTILYKQEYIAEWKKFLQSIHYAKAADFNAEIKVVDILGEAKNSPIRILMERVAKETSWDNPVVQAELAAPKTGFIAWFKRVVLRQGKEVATQQAMTQAQGQISQQFNVFYQLLRKRDDQQNQSLLDEYLNSFSQVRSKYNDLRSSGDMGPSAMSLVKTTISDQNSVFNTTQKIVDEKLLVGLSESDQQMLQKLLLSPLTQAFEVLLVPAQEELNKLWVVQAYQPYTQTLSQKYPFHPSATIQATSGEIAQIFGESGSISRFVKDHLDPLVIRRGYSLSSKTWKDLGISLSPQFVTDFKTYVAPANGIATGGLNQTGTAPATSQSNFQFYPLPNAQLLSYTLDIDGQRMNFENGVQQWVSFIWPNPGAIPGARITAVDIEGQTHTIFEAPGEYGINRLIDSAQRVERNGGFEMTWSSPQNPKLFVKSTFRLISGSSGQRGYAGLKLVDRITTSTVNRVVAAQAAPSTGTAPQNSPPSPTPSSTTAAAAMTTPPSTPTVTAASTTNPVVAHANE